MFAERGNPLFGFRQVLVRLPVGGFRLTQLLQSNIALQLRRDDPSRTGEAHQFGLRLMQPLFRIVGLLLKEINLAGGAVEGGVPLHVEICEGGKDPGCSFGICVAVAHLDQVGFLQHLDGEPAGQVAGRALDFDLAF